MKSRTARWFILAAAVTGTVGAILAGPLLALRWMEGSVPLSPWDPGDAADVRDVTQTIDLPRESFAFTWPARKGEDPAPPLRMRIAPSDWHGWWRTDAQAVALPMAGEAPLRLALEVTVPDGEAVTPQMMGTLCADSPTKPGACLLGRARVDMARGTAGRRAPSEATRRSSEGRVMATRYAFWTRIDTTSGRRRFLGWACDDGPASLPLPATAGARPEELYRCHAPDGWLERHVPALAGLERTTLTYDCDASDGCELSFLFQGRPVVLSFDESPPDCEIETTRLRLFRAAWAMLNRQHADALYPRGAIAELPEAKAQLAACRAASATFAGDDTVATALRSPAGQDRITALAIPCRRAADIAARLARSSPTEAVDILVEAMPAIAKFASPDSREPAIYQAWITAAQASGGAATLNMANALAGLLQRSAGVTRDQPGFAERETQILAARTLVTGSSDAALPAATRDQLVAALVRQYRSTDREDEVVAILEEHVEAIERVDGSESLSLARPLVRLGEAQLAQGNYIRLRRTVDLLLPVWRNAAGAPAHASDGVDWPPSAEAETGFALVLFQRSLALHDGSTASAAPVIAAVINRMVAALGAANPYVRAAQFHQHEVLSGHEVAGAPAGGGFLPKR